MILRTINPDSIENCAFSEYETYGNYAYSIDPGLYVEKEIDYEMEAYKIVGKRFFNADVLHWIAKDYDLVNLEGWGRNVPSIVSYFVNNRFYYRHVSFKSTMDWYNKHLKNKEQNARTVLRNIRSCLRRIFKIGNNEF